MRTITHLVSSSLLVPWVKTTPRFLLHCVALRVAFIIAAMSACFPVAAESIDLYFKCYGFSGVKVFPEMLHGSRSLTSDYQGAIAPFCYVGVEHLEPSHARAQNSKYYSRTLAGFDENPYDTTRRLIWDFIIQNLDCIKKQIQMFVWESGEWRCRVNAGEERWRERVMLPGTCVCAQSCTLPATVKGRQ